MAVRGSTVMQFAPSEVYQSATPPESPAVGQLWRNTGVTPNELLAWKGLSVGNARSYPGIESGMTVSFEDLSDDRTLGVTVKAVASQAGSGAPSPTNIRAIGGKSSVKVVRTGKNILKPGTTMTSAGVTTTVAVDGTVTLNGTCTGAAGTPTLFTVQMGVFLNGQFTFSANNPAAHGSDLQMRLMQDGSSQVASPLTNFTLTSIGSKLTFTLSNQYVWGYAIRVGGGATYNNVVIRPQLEAGADATAFEAYSGKDYTLIPSLALYGMAGAEDEIASDGHGLYRTELKTLAGTQPCSYHASQPTNANYARFGLTAGIKPGSVGLCSHFQWASISQSTATDAIGQDGASDIGFVIMKARMSGWSDAWAPAQKVAAFQAWLAAENTAGTPVKVLYQRASNLEASAAPVRISGAGGRNLVASDGATVSVAYTGSGWAALGAVQRMAIESVSISPEEGLRVDTVLSSADGAHQVLTFFNARGARYGLFRSSDGMMILGGMVLPNGQPAGVAGALVSPGAAGETRIGIETAASGSGQARVDTAALHLVQPSFMRATGPDFAPTGETTPVKIEAVRSTLLNAQSECVDNYSVSIKALNALRLIAMGEGGTELAWLLVQRSPEGSTIYTDGAYSASDSARTLSNFAPMIHMSMPTGESIVYNATARRYMLDWKTIGDGYGRYGSFKGGNQSLRDVGIVIRESGYYRFVFHADLEQASSSSGAVLTINRMPAEWTPPTSRDYATDADLTTRIAYRRAASAPLSASSTTCSLVADLWCFSGEKILPVVSMAAASKMLVSAGTFFTAQKIG